MIQWKPSRGEIVRTPEIDREDEILAQFGFRAKRTSYAEEAQLTEDSIVDSLALRTTLGGFSITVSNPNASYITPIEEDLRLLDFGQPLPEN